MLERIKKKKLIIIIAFFIILYIVLKGIIVYIQDLYMSNEVYNKEYGIGDVINVVSYTKEERDNTEYFSNKSTKYSIKIKNYFNNFESGDSDDNYEYYMLYNDANNVEAAFMFGYNNTQLYDIKNNSGTDNVYYEFNYFPLYISNVLEKFYLKKYDIKNDIDLIKHIRERKKVECNFFTPIFKIKENYFFNYIETSLPPIDKITYIEGDLEGYIFEMDNYKQVCIIKNGMIYNLTFFKLDYFTDDVIEDVLRSVVIE